MSLIKESMKQKILDKLFGVNFEGDTGETLETHVQQYVDYHFNHINQIRPPQRKDRNSILGRLRGKQLADATREIGHNNLSDDEVIKRF